MRYIVVLDPNSFVGAAYLAGNSDGKTKQGNPFIDCSEIEMHSPYLICTRDSESRGGLNQTVLVPHHAVSYSIGYAKEEGRPVGFAP